MKNIQSFESDKYQSDIYLAIEEGIYKTEAGYVTSLSFVQEPVLGEGSSSLDISQYPLEDIEDKFSVHVSDFYADVNQKGTACCVLEFCSPHLGNIQQLRSIIGKHVFNRNRVQSGTEYVELVIE